MEKVKNVLTNWGTTNDFGSLRIFGTAIMDQEGVANQGEVLITSPLIELYWLNGYLFAKTKNSLYMLKT